MVIGNTLWQHSLTALNPRGKNGLNGNLWMCRVFLCCSWLIYYSSTSEAAALLSLLGFHMVRWDDIWRLLCSVRSQRCLKFCRLCSPVSYNSVILCHSVWQSEQLQIFEVSTFSHFAAQATPCSRWTPQINRCICPLAPVLMGDEVGSSIKVCQCVRHNACCMRGFCFPFYAVSVFQCLSVGVYQNSLVCFQLPQ